jgi:hypothetical protein
MASSSSWRGWEKRYKKPRKILVPSQFGARARRGRSCCQEEIFFARRCKVRGEDDYSSSSLQDLEEAEARGLVRGETTTAAAGPGGSRGQGAGARRDDYSSWRGWEDEARALVTDDYSSSRTWRKPRWPGGWGEERRLQQQLKEAEAKGAGARCEVRLQQQQPAGPGGSRGGQGARARRDDVIKAQTFFGTFSVGCRSSEETELPLPRRKIFFGARRCEVGAREFCLPSHLLDGFG